MNRQNTSPLFDSSDVIEKRAKDFVGRDWVFTEIDRWLSHPHGENVFLLTGDPGSGKTAIAARLAQFSRGISVGSASTPYLSTDTLSAIHFCSARDRRSINPHVFVEALALQLAGRYPAFAHALSQRSGARQIRVEVTQHVHEVSAGQVVGIVIQKLDVSGIQAEDAFIRAVREPLEILARAEPSRQIVILVDALDEALGYSGDCGIITLLAQGENLPANVRLVLTSRPDERVCSEFQNAHALFISAAEFTALNRTDVSQYIERRFLEDEGLASLKSEGCEMAVRQIVDKSDGNFRYVSFLMNDIASGQRALGDLTGLPNGLYALYFQSLDRVVKAGRKAWSSDYAPLLGVLSVAQTSLTIGQLVAFTDQPEQVVWEHLGHLQQFIERTSSKELSEELYRLYHQSVVDFLGQPFLRTREQNTNRNPYCLWPDSFHSRIVEHYRRSAGTWADVTWREVDDYGLLYLANHIYALKDKPRVGTELDRLICKPFMQAKFERTHSHRAFATDVALGMQASGAESPPNLLRLVRYSLLYAKLGALTAHVPAEALHVLARCGQGAQARGYAALIQDPEKKSQAYRLIGDAHWASGLQEEARADLEQALAAVMLIDNIDSKTLGMTRIAVSFAQIGEPTRVAQLANQVLLALDSITPEYARVEPLRVLTVALSTAGENTLAPDLAAKALTVASSVELTRTDNVAAEALADAALANLAVGNHHSALDAINRASTHLKSQENELWNANALLKIVQVLIHTGELDRAISTAESIGLAWPKATALVGIASSLVDQKKFESAESVLNRARQMADEVTFDYGKAHILTLVGAILARLGKKEGATENANRALAALETVKDRAGRARILARIAANVAHVDTSRMASMINEAIAIVDAMGPSDNRARTIAGLALLVVDTPAHARAIELANQALIVAEKAGNDEADAARSVFLAELSTALLQKGNRDWAADVWRSALESALAIGTRIDGRSEDIQMRLKFVADAARAGGSYEW